MNLSTRQSPEQAPILSKWLAPTSVSEFRRVHLGRTPFYAPASKERLDTALPLLPSWQTKDILPRVEQAVAWFPALDGSLKIAEVSARAAEDLHDAGTTLYLRRIAALDALADDLSAGLAIPRTMLEVTLFCNRVGARTRMHFDRVGTITMQIRGRKRWTVARNDAAPKAHLNWTTLNPFPPGLRHYAHDLPPSTMPESAESFSLEPGAVLYVPEGYWHETESDLDSCSLHIHVLNHYWVDALLSTLRCRLIADESFRGTAYTLWAPEDRESTRTHVRALMDSAASSLAQMTVDDVLPRVAGERGAEGSQLFQRRYRTGWGIEARRGEAGEQLVTLVVDEQGVEEATTLEMSEIFVSACQVLDRSGPVAAADLARSVPGMTDAEAAELLELLTEHGFLRRVSQAPSPEMNV